MRVLGKLAGAGIGYFFGGPFGALAGVALGHQLFDRPPREFFGVPMSGREVKNSVFFAAAFSMLGKLAQADGRVSDEELAAIKSVITNKFGLTRKTAEYAYQVFTDAVNDDTSFESHARAFHSQFSESPEALASMLEIMLIIAHADYDYDESEETLVRSAADIFGIADEYESLLALYLNEPDNINHCFDLLGVSTGASDEEIEAHYQHLLSEHDPQVLLDEGVPKELINVAEEKLDKIRRAYTRIQAYRAEPESAEASQ